MELFEHLRRTLGLGADEAFDLVDIGMGNYSRNLAFAPTEFAIVPNAIHKHKPHNYNDARYVESMLIY